MITTIQILLKDKVIYNKNRLKKNQSQNQTQKNIYLKMSTYMPLLCGFIVFVVFILLLFLVPLVIQTIWNTVIVNVVKQRVTTMTYWQAFAFWLFIALLVTGLQIPFSLASNLRGC